MKYHIPKEWIERNAHKEEGLEIGAGAPSHPSDEPSRSCAPLAGYARWSLELKTLARKRGLEWLIADDEAWMRETYNDGDTAKEALDHLIAEATRSA